CPDGMLEARDCVLDHATYEDSWLMKPEGVLDRAFWRHGLPLTRHPFTNVLALWAHDPDVPEPPVPWLHHDRDSYLLAPSFATSVGGLLEQCVCLGFDWGPGYTDPETRLMDTSCESARQRRRLLGLGQP